MKGKIFNEQEVQAMLNGSKVMFREVAKIKLNLSCYDVDKKEFYDDPIFKKCPYQVGQKIFVKESFYEDLTYRKFAGFEAKDGLLEINARYMKQEHSRLTLQIIEIRAERLRDIDEEGARQEGVIDSGCGNCGESEFDCKCKIPEPLPKDDFIFNWNATHKKPEEEFNANPWVWVLKFELVKNNL